MESSQLPPFAINLSAGQPRTSKFYLLPFVRSLGSYVKETTLTLSIPDSFRFRDGDGQRLVFTKDIKSLYTVIPNDGGLRAPQYYLVKREMLEPPTDTLLRMAEVILTLNTFELNGEFYKQTSVPGYLQEASS